MTKRVIMDKEDFKASINNLINIMRKNELMTMTNEKIWSELVSVDPLTQRILGDLTDEIFWGDVSKLNDKQLTKIVSTMYESKIKSWLENMQDEQLIFLFVTITDINSLARVLFHVTEEQFLVLTHGLPEQKLWNLFKKMKRDQIDVFVKNLSDDRMRNALEMMSRDERADFMRVIHGNNMRRMITNMTQANLLKLIEDVNTYHRRSLIENMNNQQLMSLVKDMSVDQYVDFVRTLTNDENE